MLMNKGSLKTQKVIESQDGLKDCLVLMDHFERRCAYTYSKFSQNFENNNELKIFWEKRAHQGRLYSKIIKNILSLLESEQEIITKGMPLDRMKLSLKKYYDLLESMEDYMSDHDITIENALEFLICLETAGLHSNFRELMFALEPNLKINSLKVMEIEQVYQNIVYIVSKYCKGSEVLGRIPDLIIENIRLTSTFTNPKLNNRDYAFDNMRITNKCSNEFPGFIEQCPFAALVTDTKGNIEYVNKRFTRLTKYTPEETIGKSPRILQSGKTPIEVYKRLWFTIKSGNEWQGELLNKKKNGEYYWELLNVSPIRNKNGVIAHYLGILQDITNQKINQEKQTKKQDHYRYLSFHDSLTGLYSRTYFDEEVKRLNKNLSRAIPISILVIDLDGLKNVNDTYGHQMGDEILKLAAKIISKAFREGDMIARIGGDEFCVLLPRTNYTQVEIKAGEILLLIDEFNQGNVSVPLSMSIGFASSLNEENIHETYLRADEDMYQWKNESRLRKN